VSNQGARQTGRCGAHVPPQRFCATWEQILDLSRDSELLHQLAQLVGCPGEVLGRLRGVGSTLCVRAGDLGHFSYDLSKDRGSFRLQTCEPGDVFRTRGNFAHFLANRRGVCRKVASEIPAMRLLVLATAS
jgi:hypothetical protein